MDASALRLLEVAPVAIAVVVVDMAFPRRTPRCGYGRGRR